VAHNSAGTDTKALNLNHYGTRHRSMLRYCATYPNSLGFVVSQDGDVRAITHSGNRVVLWDNIRIQSIRNARTIRSEYGGTTRFPRETQRHSPIRQRQLQRHSKKDLRPSGSKILQFEARLHKSRT
jgi:hypothetical protein